MRMLIFLSIILFINCNGKNDNYKNYSYKSTITINGKTVITHLNWFNENPENGGLVIESINHSDSLLEIQKYIFWKKGDTINLSSEFENGIHTYLLKLNQNKNLVIYSIPHTNDSLLFGLNLNEIVLEKEE